MCVFVFLYVCERAVNLFLKEFQNDVQVLGGMWKEFLLSKWKGFKVLETSFQPLTNSGQRDEPLSLCVLN